MIINDADRQHRARQAMRGFDVSPTRSSNAQGILALCLVVLGMASCHFVPAHSAEPPQSALIVTGATTKQVVNVMSDGQLYWNGRLVTTDAQFRAAMLQAMVGMRCSQ